MIKAAWISKDMVLSPINFDALKQFGTRNTTPRNFEDLSSLFAIKERNKYHDEYSWPGTLYNKYFVSFYGQKIIKYSFSKMTKM